MPDFIPRGDSDFARFAANFARKAAEAQETLGVSPQTITDLLEAEQAWASAHARASDPDTATRPVIREKCATRQALEARIRVNAHRARRILVSSEDELVCMGLRPRAPRRRQIPVPATAPELQIISTIGRRVRARVSNPATPLRRGLPVDVREIVIYTCVAETASDRFEDWKLRATSTRAIFNFDFPADLPVGTMVWLMTRFANYRSEMGPCSAAVGMSINHAGPSRGHGGLVRRRSA